jgi:adenylate cyclase
VLINRCLAIDPCCAMAWQRRGWIAIYRGAGTALADFRRCLSLSGAHDLDRHNILFGISSAHFLAGRYDRAADWAVRGIQQQPSASWAYRIAAPAQALCGRKEEARKSAAMLLRHYPEQMAPMVVASLPMQPEFLARHAEGLEAAGLPV